MKATRPISLLAAALTLGCGAVAHAQRGAGGSPLDRPAVANELPKEAEGVDVVERLGEQALKLADQIDSETHAVVARSIANAKLGGSLREQLSGRYIRSDSGTLEEFLKLKDTQMKATPQQAAGGRQATIAFFADQLFDAGREPRAEKLQKLLKVTSERKALVERINRDVTLRARLNIWLYLHIPMTIALLAALLVHIVSVFLYW